MIWTFFNFGKFGKFDDPQPHNLIWEKLEIRKIMTFGNPSPLRKI